MTSSHAEYLEDHARLLGQLVGNLHSLEFVLRAFLYERGDPPHTPLPEGESLESMKTGDEVALNALTDFSSLGRLVDRYNKLVGSEHAQQKVDRSIVGLRDALAHGRVSTNDPSVTLHLLKFDKPSGGKTRVVFSQRLGTQWFKAQTALVLAQMRKVANAMGAQEMPALHGPAPDY